MKAKIIEFVRRTQKATAALAGAVGVLTSATFLPAPWGQYAAIASVFLTWGLTYFFPYVEKTVQDFPFDQADWIPAPELEIADKTPTAFVGHLLAPSTDTVEIEAVTLPPAPATTIGIPLVEVDDDHGRVVRDEYEDEVPADDQQTVDEILDRLSRENANA